MTLVTRMLASASRRRTMCACLCSFPFLNTSINIVVFVEPMPSSSVNLYMSRNAHRTQLRSRIHNNRFKLLSSPSSCGHAAQITAVNGTVLYKDKACVDNDRMHGGAVESWPDDGMHAW
jgi:hypothetical protein